MLGVALVDAEPDRVRVRRPFRPHVSPFGDLVHGGAIGALVDVHRHGGGVVARPDRGAGRAARRSGCASAS